MANFVAMRKTLKDKVIACVLSMVMILAGCGVTFVQCLKANTVSVSVAPERVSCRHCCDCANIHNNIHGEHHGERHGEHHQCAKHHGVNIVNIENGSCMRYLSMKTSNVTAPGIAKAIPSPVIIETLPATVIATAAPTVISGETVSRPSVYPPPRLRLQKLTTLII